MAITNVRDDPRTTNTFLAILHSTHKKEIVITEDEYDALKELRRMKAEERHCMKMFGCRDGKLCFYDVKLTNTVELKSRLQSEDANERSA